MNKKRNTGSNIKGNRKLDKGTPQGPVASAHQHVFWSSWQGEQGWRIKPINRNLGMQVTHATLAPVPLVNTSHMAVPNDKNEEL